MYIFHKFSLRFHSDLNSGLIGTAFFILFQKHHLISLDDIRYSEKKQFVNPYSFCASALCWGIFQNLILCIFQTIQSGFICFSSVKGHNIIFFGNVFSYFCFPTFVFTFVLFFENKEKRMVIYRPWHSTKGVVLNPSLHFLGNKL